MISGEVLLLILLKQKKGETQKDLAEKIQT